MTFTIIISDKAKKNVKKYPADLRKKLLKKLDQLTDFPKNLDIKKMGFRTYRIRTGDFRIIIDVFFEEKTINVVKIDVRGRVY